MVFRDVARDGSIRLTGALPGGGSVGPIGPDGPQGIQGIQGLQGIQGIQGLQGIDGPPGVSSTWLTGSGVPAGGTGVVGDMYLRSNGDYYKKTGASVWTVQGSILGPQGIQGIQGIQGPIGLPAPEAAVHTNPGFETGATPVSGTGGDGWKKYDPSSTATWSFDTTDKYEDTRSMKVVAPAGADTRFSGAFESGGFQPGAVVTISAMAKTSVSAGLTIRFISAPTAGQADYFGSGMVEQSVGITIGTAWQKAEASFVLPATHTKWRFYLDGQNNRTWWFDRTGSRVQVSNAGSLDVTDLAVAAAGSHTSTTKPTRRGLVCDLYFAVVTTAAISAGVGSITIPTVHVPVSSQNRYFMALDDASGGQIPVYLNGNTIRWVFARATGQGTLGHITYVANP